MNRTGELLKKAREDKKLSLHEVALFLKINSRVLQAIEDGDQTQLPARTFLRGFVQSYAKFLKLDPQSVLQIFTEENGPSPAPQINPLVSASIVATSSVPPDEAAAPAAASEASSPASTDRAELDVISLEKSVLAQNKMGQDKLGVKTIAASIIGLVIVFVLYFANNVIKKYQKEALVERPSGAAVAPLPETAPAVANSDSLIPSASDATVPTPTEVDSSKTTPLALTPDAVSTASAPDPKPKLPADASNSIEKTGTPKPLTVVTPPEATKPLDKPATVTTAPPVPPAAAPAVSKPEGKLIEVIIEANDAVEIEYSSAKTSPQKMVLKPEQIHTFKSRSGVRLKISNGGAVNIIMNGRDLGAPGAAGQPIQVTY
jgi:cytoskeleton protein RodZ